MFDLRSGNMPPSLTQSKLQCSKLLPRQAARSRESFIYKKSRDKYSSTNKTSNTNRVPSTTSTNEEDIGRLTPATSTGTGLSTSVNLPQNGFLVTPFGQVLYALRNIRTILYEDIELIKFRNNFQIDDADRHSTILCDLDWCILQLESMNTNKSISEMASNKFKQMLKNELNMAANRRNGKVHDFLSSNFMDKSYDEIKFENLTSTGKNKKNVSLDDLNRKLDSSSSKSRRGNQIRNSNSKETTLSSSTLSSSNEESDDDDFFSISSSAPSFLGMGHMTEI